MRGDENIHNPVEQYLKDLMDLDKPEKPPETIAEPTVSMEVRGNGKFEKESDKSPGALKVADTLEHSLKANTSSTDSKQIKNSRGIFNVGRHPIGLILICTVAVVLGAVGFSIAGFFLPGLASTIGVSVSVVGLIAGFTMLAIIIIGIGSLLIFGRAYLKDRLILTDVELARSSQSYKENLSSDKLPVTDIEEVSVKKDGPLPMLFNYGTLTIKNSNGNRSIVFKYLPDPELYAKIVQDVKLEYLARRADSSRL